MGARRVLVVDDDIDMSHLLTEVLSARGIDAIRCDTLAEVMRALPEAHAVVTDVNLQRDSGLDLCSRILVERPGMPVVVISGDQDAKQAAMRHGAARFLLKPVDMTVLVRLLEELTPR